MEGLEFTGKIEQVGNSLYFVITEINSGKEQRHTLVEVSSNASPCLMFGRWELALSGNFFSEEMEISNKEELEAQIKLLHARIDEHFRLGCSCTETIETKYFRKLSARMEGTKVILSVGLFENSIGELIHHDFVEFDSTAEFLKALISILEWGVSHKSFSREPVLNLGEIVHTGYDVIASVGTLYEDWVYNKDLKIDQDLEDKIVLLLKDAFTFQEELD